MSELVQRNHQPSPVPAKQTTAPLSEILRPGSLSDALRLAEMICKSSIAPKALQDDPMAVLSLMEFGERVGMGLMESVQNVAIINGKFSIYGDRMKAIVMASGLLEDFKETHEEDKDGNWTSATCWARRKGLKSPAESTFSMKMAARAGLLQRNAVWKSYPERMLTMRARSFVLRDLFSDVLAGMITREEAGDYAYDAQTGEQVPVPPSARMRDVTPPADAAEERGGKGEEAKEPDGAAGKPSDDDGGEAALAMVLRGIESAKTLEHLDQVAGVAKELPPALAAKARPLFSAKRSVLMQAEQPKSKAQLLMERRQGRDEPSQAEGELR